MAYTNYKKSHIFMSLLSKRKNIKKLRFIANSLQYLKKKNYQNLFYLLNKNSFIFNSNYFFIFYIVYFYFLKSNTILHILNAAGDSKIFYTAGSSLIGFTGKQKKARKVILLKFFSLLSLAKKKVLRNYPIAIHFKNVRSNKYLVTKKLKNKFFIKIIKSFELNSYNGCRKKKSKRKR